MHAQIHAPLPVAGRDDVVVHARCGAGGPHHIANGADRAGNSSKVGRGVVPGFLGLPVRGSEPGAALESVDEVEPAAAGRMDAEAREQPTVFVLDVEARRRNRRRRECVPVQVCVGGARKTGSEKDVDPPRRTAHAGTRIADLDFVAQRTGALRPGRVRWRLVARALVDERGFVERVDESLFFVEDIVDDLDEFVRRAGPERPREALIDLERHGNEAQGRPIEAIDGDLRDIKALEFGELAERENDGLETALGAAARERRHVLGSGERRAVPVKTSDAQQRRECSRDLRVSWA